MGKLIYADSFDNYVNKFPNWNKNTDETYYSVVFTNDGYLATHGKQYALTLVGEDASNQINIALNSAKTGIILSGPGITSSTANLPVYSIKGVENNPVLVEGSGEFTIKHKTAPTETTNTNSYGGINNYTITVPTIYVDSFGHVSTASSTKDVAVDVVSWKSAADDSTDIVPLLLGTSMQDTTGTAVYHENIKANLGTGALYAGTIYENGKSLSSVYAYKTTKATNTQLGLVTLSDAIDDETKKASNGVAATPYALTLAIAEAVTQSKTHSDALFQAHSDAMVFMGTLKANGIIVSHNSAVASNKQLNITDNTTKIIELATHSVGWTWKFTTAGTFSYGDFSQNVEIGDMLVCIASGTTNKATYTIVQTNINGSITSTDVMNPGIVYVAQTGRTVTSLANPSTANQILSWDGSSLKWRADYSRAISVNGTQWLTNNDGTSLNFVADEGINIAGGTDGTLTIKNTKIPNTTISFFNNPGTVVELPIKYSPIQSTGTYDGTGSVDFYFEKGITATNASNSKQLYIGHSNSVQAVGEVGLHKLSWDAQGHITGSEAVTLNALSITDGTTSDTYDTSTAKTLKFADGTDIALSLTSANNVLTVTPSITHKYKAVSYYKTANATSTTSISGNTSSAVSFKPGNNVELSHSGTTLTISSINTWRGVNAYTLSGSTLSTVLDSIGTEALQFGNEFAWDNKEIKLVWTEISGDTITYHT